MKYIDTVKISCYNLVRRKNTSIKILAGFFFVVILCASFISFNVSVAVQFDAMLNKQLSANFIRIGTGTALSDEQHAYLNSLEKVNEIRTRHRRHFSGESVYDISVGGEPYFKRYIDEHFWLTSLDGSELIAGNEIKELGKRAYAANLVDITKMGDKDVIFSNAFLVSAGISPSDILNKRISIKEIINEGHPEFDPDRDVEIILQDYTVIGVFDQSLDLLTGRADYNEKSELFVKNMPSDFNGFDNVTTDLFFDNYTDGNETFAAVKAYFAEWENDGSGSVHYTADYIYTRYVVLERQQRLCNKIISLIGIVLLAALMINLIVILLFDIKKKGGYFGVLKAQGMTNANIFQIIFNELYLLFSVAAVAAMAVTVLIMELVSGMTNKLVGITTSLNAGAYGLIFLSVIAAGLLVVFLLSLLLIKSRLKRTAARLLS
ncbi:MAG: FtsX-like permease family protein [Clostridiales bacterium]|jgi:hypothetical protein|nr:FtsX-like permease family protein [Clostridiales bacterium]